MKITISGSLSFAKEMKEVRDELIKMGNIVLTPEHLDECISDQNRKTEKWSIKDFIDGTKGHYDKIEKSDAVLVFNLDKKGIKGYVGASSFSEAVIAVCKDKKIFFYNDLPDMSYIKGDLECMGGIVINQDLSLIK